jgi:hypothetical protein
MAKDGTTSEVREQLSLSVGRLYAMCLSVIPAKAGTQHRSFETADERRSTQITQNEFRQLVSRDSGPKAHPFI